MVDALEVAERREVLVAGFGDCAHESYGSGHYARHEEGVVVEHWSTFGEGIDFDMGFVWGLVTGFFGRAGSILPVGIWTASDGDGLGGFPWWFVFCGTA